MKKKKKFKCKYCGRIFDSEQALASHLRVHKKRKAKVKSEDDPPNDPPKLQQLAQPQPQLLTQPVPQQYIPQYVQQQVQAQNNKSYGPIEILFALLSTPTFQAIAEWLQNKGNNREGDDPLRQLAFQQMIDAWRFMHELGKRYSETPIEMMKIAWQNITTGKKRVIMLPVPIPIQDDEKEKLILVQLAKKLEKLDKLEKLEDITEKLKELLDEEEEDGEFVSVGDGELL